MNQKFAFALLVMYMLLVGFGLLVTSHAEVSNYAVMVWDRKCLDSLELSDKSWVEAPLVNGEPDYKRMIVYKTKIKLEETCGRIEIRKESR